MYQKKFRKRAEKKPAMKRRRRWCGKICYDSPREAEEAVREFTRSGKLAVGKIGILEKYYCKRCRSHHIGHNRMKVVA